MDTRDMSIRQRLDHVARVLDSLAAPDISEMTIYGTRYRIAAAIWLKNGDEFRRVMVGRKALIEGGYIKCEIDGVEFNARDGLQEVHRSQWQQVQL